MKWLFLVHQIQTRNSRERVKIWRFTKKIGAILYRNSVYVLPFGKERLEDFQWLCQQIRDSQGEASVFVSESSDQKEDEKIRSLFSQSRETDYQNLIELLTRLSERVRRAKAEDRLSPPLQKSLSKEATHLATALSEIERIDFFDAPHKRKVKAMIEHVKKELASAAPAEAGSAPIRRYDRKEFRRKTWTTRKGIHIDRLGSAWLIRRFIDPQATFVFAPESKFPQDAIPFDAFGVEFGHHGEDCTFETLLKTFRIKDKALDVLAQIVHDIDMKDEKYARPEAAGLDMVLRSLSDAWRDDHKVLETGSQILDALYARLTKPKR
jgi:hypothetical protein